MKRIFIAALAALSLVSCSIVDSSEVGIKFKKFSLTDQGQLKASNQVAEAEANAKIAIAKPCGPPAASRVQNRRFSHGTLSSNLRGRSLRGYR